MYGPPPPPGSMPPGPPGPPPPGHGPPPPGPHGPPPPRYSPEYRSRYAYPPPPRVSPRSMYRGYRYPRMGAPPPQARKSPEALPVSSADNFGQESGGKNVGVKRDVMGNAKVNEEDKENSGLGANGAQVTNGGESGNVTKDTEKSEPKDGQVETSGDALSTDADVPATTDVTIKEEKKDNESPGKGSMEHAVDNIIAAGTFF